MKKRKHSWLKTAMIAIGAVVAIFGLSSCTKSFCTNQDKANQMYASYGNIFEDSVVVADPSDVETEKGIKNQNTNRATLYSTLQASGFTLPTKTFQDYITAKAKTEAIKTVHYWTDTDALLGTIDNEETAKQIAFHIALYGGVTTNSQGKVIVADLWTNFNAWYLEAIADPTVGVLNAPSNGYVTLLKSTMLATNNANTACITPDSRNFVQNGATIYIQGKTWGQAFSEYGFLEGLFVYPFAYLVHVISGSLGESQWAQILAIFVITVLSRIVTVLSSISQSKTQARQQRLQPEINALQRKYPNSSFDKDERQAMTMEQAQLMKKNKVHPLLPMLWMLLQFPLFICVWSALQGSAVLAEGNWFGLSLSTLVSSCFLNYANTPGALVGIMIFIFMTLANVLSSLTSLWFTTWRNKNFGSPTPAAPSGDAASAMDPNKTMKIMTYVMMGFVIIMGWSLPAGMGIYWFLGAWIAVLQSVFTEVFYTRSRHRQMNGNGDGSDLASMRRSKHHRGDSETKAQKPLWRK
jgi:YidC/Oxa1 family membrane protein insertase